MVPIGGDGTFLLTASRACPLFYNKKPVIGFNSDPDRSEGRLMLPKEYSSEPKEAVQKLINVSSLTFQKNLFDNKMINIECMLHLHIQGGIRLVEKNTD